mmetsp:Transcript_12096/g.15034  ORF Transcript_12096/g.15034 Transcript_12096/m.15034 type:complete len:98 (-) Transcript_12096:490-783(-)
MAQQHEMKNRLRSESAFELNHSHRGQASDWEMEIVAAFCSQNQSCNNYENSFRTCRPRDPVARLFSQQLDREIQCKNRTINSPVKIHIQPSNNVIAA